MKKHLRYIAIFLMILSSLKFSGCEIEDLDFNINCNACYDEIPVEDSIFIQVSLDEENPFVPLEIYIGDLEDNQLLARDTAHNEVIFHPAKVDVKYSVKATYKKEGVEIIAVDGDRIRIVDGEADCWPDCYFLRAGTFDVSLK